MNFSKELKSFLYPYQNQPFVFLETALQGKENKVSFLFTDFYDILVFHYYDDMNSFFEKIENYLKKGFWVCGYFCYEFGYFLEPALFSLKEKFSFPVAWLGVCKKPIFVKRPFCASLVPNSYSLKNLTLNITEEEYNLAIKKIKEYLEGGLTYQVNFTFKVKFNFFGDFLDFYLDLRKAQPTSYLSLIDTFDRIILSFSPELFFRKKQNKIVVRPMKGTVKKGLLSREDERNRKYLKKSRKTQAENIMIVDLLRNDLGKIAEKVKVREIFEIENYRTLYQMTSTIEADLKKKKIKDIFYSLFPSGSVTGAPKIKTMQLIKGLEKEPRKIYTGCIGYFSPQGKFCFNVAIRTILLEKNKGELGVGGGIVYDSLDKTEYKEALLKAKFLIEKFPSFSLIESILWQKNKGYFLLDLHLKRLKNSCQYFCVPLNLEKLKRNLKNLEESLKRESAVYGKEKFKIRVLVNLEGEFEIESLLLEEIKLPVKVKISSFKINPQNVFLYHKTTKREIYEEELMKVRKEGFFEVIFFNIYDELTEGAITNVFLLKGDVLYTPSLKCGLLPGILREYLLKKKRVKEKILLLKDLKKANKVFVGNSVRGLMEAEILIVGSEEDDKIKEEVYITHSHE